MPRRRSRRAANQIVQKAGANGPNAGANGPNAKANRPNDKAKGGKPGANGPNAGPNQPNDKKLTPYQGSDRAFGIFRCTKCKRSWMSSCTWANTAQKCFKCNIFIYPFMQLPLETEDADKLNKSNPNKPHHQERCQKCLLLGSFCGENNTRRRRRKKNHRRRPNPSGAVAGA